MTEKHAKELREARHSLLEDFNNRFAAPQNCLFKKLLLSRPFYVLISEKCVYFPYLPEKGEYKKLRLRSGHASQDLFIQPIAGSNLLRFSRYFPILIGMYAFLHLFLLCAYTILMLYFPFLKYIFALRIILSLCVIYWSLDLSIYFDLNHIFIYFT